MSTDKQIAANKANASKSTGPKTVQGKSTAARNALKHGLTLPPSSEAVVTWLKIILDRPDLTFDNFGDDPESRAALELAEAEASLERALAAERDATLELVKYARTHKEPDLFKLDLEDFDDPAVLKLMLKWRPDKKLRDMLRVLLVDNTNSLPSLARRVERVQRYVRDAERRKARALKAWQSAKRAASDKTNPIAASG